MTGAAPKTAKSPGRAISPAPPALRLRLLGELEVLRGDERLPLPPSKKTRALLAFLAATGRPHRRERLCSMFWEIPNDPRGALRWSVSRLRAIVDAPGELHMQASREAVAFSGEGAEIDLLRIREAAAEGFETLATGRLQTLASLFRGEFLEGLDLPDLHDFQSWCIAEREDLRRLQIRILTLLAERLAGTPEEAAQAVRQLVQIDPFNEAARIELLRLLLVSGRRQEAESHFETAERLFRDIDEEAPYRLKRAWRDMVRLREGAIAPAPAASARETPPHPEAVTAAYSRDRIVARLPERTKLVGRARELQHLLATLNSASSGYAVRVVAILGEPGIGKSRLCAELAESARSCGVEVFIGRCYDAGLGPAYGPWSEALGGLPQNGEAAAPVAGREKLFAAVAARILPGAMPALLVLEDVHWIDEASASLLHHIVRAGRNHPLTIVLTAREGELPDNPAVSGVLRSLRHEGIAEELRLAPLAEEDLRALIGGDECGADCARIVALCGGNPLYAIELARNQAEAPGGVPLSLRELVRGRVERLPSGAAELLRWASVLGPSVDIEKLRRIAPLDLDEFMAGLELLERHGMFAPVETGDAAGSYVFSHDLVRRAIYTSLSEPRRRLMHLKIARMLDEMRESDEALALEIAHHAAAGGDSGMAAAACVSAGRRCIRVFANAEARALVRRGLHYAEKLPVAERVQRTIELLQIETSVMRPDDVQGFLDRLEALAGQALDHDLPDHARRAYTMLANLRWEEGAWHDAQRETLRAELVSRSVEGPQRVVALGEAARCLAMLERDLPLAEAMALEAAALARRSNTEPNAIADAAGLLQFHRGEFEAAAEQFQRARTLARRDGDRISEFLALEHLAALEIARKRYGEVKAICGEMLLLAEKMRHGSELPYASALDALCRCANGEADAMAGLETALGALRIADTKQRLAEICIAAAGLLLERGDLNIAKRLAEEALSAAELLNRPSDMAASLALLCRIARAGKDARGAKAFAIQLGGLDLAQLSASAKKAVETALAADGGLAGKAL